MHRLIADELRAAIRAGTYPRGTQLPSELELARRYGVARGTVRQALACLKTEGALISRRGARAVVLAQPRAQSLSELLSFSAWARALGEVPRGRVVSLGRHLADEVDAERLDLEPGRPVFRLVRVRLLGALPVLIERTTFPEAVGRRVAAIDLEQCSIYEQLSLSGISFAHGRHEITAVAADDEDARLLELAPGSALLRQLRVASSPAGEPLEWSDDRYRGDAVAFTVANAGAADRTLAQTVKPWAA